MFLLVNQLHRVIVNYAVYRLWDKGDSFFKRIYVLLLVVCIMFGIYKDLAPGRHLLCSQIYMIVHVPPLGYPIKSLYMEVDISSQVVSPKRLVLLQPQRVTRTTFLVVAIMTAIWEHYYDHIRVARYFYYQGQEYFPECQISFLAQI